MGRMIKIEDNKNGGGQLSRVSTGSIKSDVIILVLQVGWLEGCSQWT